MQHFKELPPEKRGIFKLNCRENIIFNVCIFNNFIKLGFSIFGLVTYFITNIHVRNTIYKKKSLQSFHSNVFN